VAGLPAICRRRDHCGLASLGERRDDPFIGVERLVGDEHVGLHRGQQVVGADQVVHLPPVRKKPTGLPSASTSVWILVLNPPRDRPSA
jgi:hypothetical protein